MIERQGGREGGGYVPVIWAAALRTAVTARVEESKSANVKAP